MAVEKLTTPFNGNFDAVTTPTERFAPNLRTRWRYEMPDWAFHNGKSGRVNTYESLHLENVNASGDDPNYALSMGKSKQVRVGLQDSLPPITEITHNRMYVLKDTKTLTFDIKVTQQSNDDKIVASMGYDSNWQPLGEYRLSQMSEEFKSVRFDVPSTFPETTSQLKFELQDGGDNSLDAELLLDNIFFEEEVSV